MKKERNQWATTDSFSSRDQSQIERRFSCVGLDIVRLNECLFQRSPVTGVQFTNDVEWL